MNQTTVIFGIPVLLDDRVELNEMFMIPSELADQISICDSAEVLARHGIISQATYDEMAEDLKNKMVQAADENRIGYIRL